MEPNARRSRVGRGEGTSAQIYIGTSRAGHSGEKVGDAHDTSHVTVAVLRHPVNV